MPSVRRLHDLHSRDQARACLRQSVPGAQNLTKTMTDRDSGLVYDSQNLTLFGHLDREL